MNAGSAPALGEPPRRSPTATDRARPPASSADGTDPGPAAPSSTAAATAAASTTAASNRCPAAPVCRARSDRVDRIVEDRRRGHRERPGRAAAARRRARRARRAWRRRAAGRPRCPTAATAAGRTPPAGLPDQLQHHRHQLRHRHVRRQRHVHPLPRRQHGEPAERLPGHPRASLSPNAHEMSGALPSIAAEVPPAGPFGETHGHGRGRAAHPASCHRHRRASWRSRRRRSRRRWCRAAC